MQDCHKEKFSCSFVTFLSCSRCTRSISKILLWMNADVHTHTSNTALLNCAATTAEGSTKSVCPSVCLEGFDAATATGFPVILPSAHFFSIFHIFIWLLLTTKSQIVFLWILRLSSSVCCLNAALSLNCLPTVEGNQSTRLYVLLRTVLHFMFY